jgi:2-polyprenyl-3-methyl-5-hydroxy-6-metoxy-1,4-benzoquinol methylase
LNGKIDMAQQNQYAAVHLPGGNLFDDIRLDIAKSHETLAGLSGRKQRPRGFSLLNRLRYLVNGALQKFSLQEVLVTSGLRRAWFDEFHDYWQNILAGRPLKVLDFFMLAHDYRKRQQHTRELNWASAEQHVQNWQAPSELYSTFAFVRNDALRPVIAPRFWSTLKAGDTVLEYGCSLAPFYSCYRKFYSHLDCQWTLADIANFPLHYAKYRYRHDTRVEFRTIEPDSFRDPLGSERKYNVIVLTTVLEHLDDPVYVMGYLTERLQQGGYLVFDYVISEGKGLDTPQALKMRMECLKWILERFDIVEGRVDIERDVPVVVARRR